MWWYEKSQGVEIRLSGVYVSYVCKCMFGPVQWYAPAQIGAWSKEYNMCGIEKEIDSLLL